MSLMCHKKNFIIAGFIFFAFTLVAFKNSFKSLPSIALEKALDQKNSMPAVIIGLGPAGGSAALYTSRQGIKTLVIAGNNPGGALSGTTDVENWPGRPNVLGPVVMDDLKKQAESFGATILYGDSVSSVDFSQWPFVIKTDGGKIINAFSVVIATGSTPRTLEVPGEYEYWGKGVTTCAICDAPYHKGSDVIVVGGGDSAIEEAIQLAPYAKSITILVRKDEGQMRASQAMQDKLKHYKHITVAYNTEIKKISGDDSKVTSVELFNNKTGQVITKNITGVFLAIGHIPNTQLFEKQLELDEAGYIKLKGRTQETSIPGVFSAGDVDDHQFKQAGYAAGEGIAAGLGVGSFLQRHNFTPAIANQIAHNFFSLEKIDRASIEIIGSLSELRTKLQNARGLVLVDFYANYCPSCMQMLPIFEEIAAKYEDITFLKVDTSKTSDISDAYHVTSIPCLLAFKDSQLIARYNQAMNRKQLEEFIAKLNNSMTS